MPNQVRASHILVNTKQEAHDILMQIQNGADFGALAQKHSSCPSGKKGGDLGFFGRGKMVAEFDRAAFSMQVSSVSNPIKTQFGYHLIKVTDSK